MKLKYIIIVSLILAILTLGAVSASEDVDALAVDEGGAVDDIQQASPDDEALIGGDGDEVPADVKANDFNVEIKRI